MRLDRTAAVAEDDETFESYLAPLLTDLARDRTFRRIWTDLSPQMTPSFVAYVNERAAAER